MSAAGQPGQLGTVAGETSYGRQLGTVAGETSYGTTEGIPPIPGRRSGPATPARPAHLGTVAGERSFGAQLGGDWGANEGYPPLPVRAQFASEGVSVVVEAQSGETRATATADRRFGAQSVDVTLEANAVADYQVTIPYAPAFERWPFAVVHVGFDGERIFRGRLETTGTDPDAGETTLAGPGPLGQLRRGDVSITFTTGATEFLDQAIDAFLADHAPDGLRYRVVTPQSEDRVPLPNATDGDREFEGTPLKVFAELAALAGMTWTVDHSRRDPFIEVFYPGIHSQRDAPWRTLDYSRERDLADYANEIHVYGAEKNDGSGERFYAEVRDETEINEVTNGVPEIAPITQPDLKSDADCQARANAELQEAIGHRQLSASATTTPTLVSVPPGYYYRLEELEGEGATNEGAAYLPLTTTKYVESAGEASTELGFEDSDAVRDALRNAAREASEPGERSLKRID